VSDALRGSIIKCYYLEVRRIRRRLTFEGVENVLAELEKKLYNNIFIPGERTALTKEEILGTLLQIKETLIYQHNSLFIHLVENLINKVELFGLHFETIDDLKNAGNVMNKLYSNEHYKKHLQRRKGKQTIMLGFSDGTKDGGYLMANWSIYKAKEDLTKISKQYNIDVLFFDGRGGPPSRG